MLSNALKTLIFLVGFVLAATGCQNHSSTAAATEPSPAPPVVVDPHSNETQVQNLSSLGTKDPCDLEIQDIKLEIAKALDAHADLVAKGLQNDKDAQKNFVKPIQLGSLTILNVDRVGIQQALQEREVKRGWRSTQKSWSQIVSAYKHVISDTDATADDWASLSTMVTSMLVSDMKRIMQNYHPDLNKDRGPLLKRLHKALKACSNDVTCLNVKLDSDEIEFLKMGNLESKYWDTINNSQLSNQDRRQAVANLKSRIKEYLRLYTITPNDNIKLSDNTLEVPLNTVELGDAAPAFINMLEQYWRSSQMQIKIKSSTATDVYRVVLNPPQTKNSSVNRSTLEFRVTPLDMDKSIFQEFGRVLGLPLEVYTTWNPRTCSYIEDFDFYNLMSRYYTGEIQKKHWSMLNDFYK